MMMRKAPMTGQPHSQAWLRRLVGLMGPDRRYGVSALGAAALVVLAGLGSPLVIRKLLDGNGSRSLWLAVLVVLGIVRALMIYVRRWHAGRLSAGTEATLRMLIHDHLQTLDPVTHDALAQGQVVSRANADIGLIGGLLSFGPLLSSTLVQLVLSVVVMAMLSPLLTIITVALFPPMLLLGRQLRKWTFPANLDALAKVGDLTTKAEEAISGVRVVKSFGQERRELTAFDRSARDVFGSRMRSARITSRWSPPLAAVPSFGLVAVLLVGGHAAIDGSLSVGTLVAFFTYLSQLAAPVRMSSLILTITQQARAGAERIFELLDYRPSIIDAPDAEPIRQTEAGKMAGRVTLTDAVVAYPGGHRALDGATVEIAPGERVALVGVSGSGKSTVALGVARFVEVAEGSIVIDGQDVRDVTLASLRRAVSVVFEDAFLFSMSVRENLSFARPDASFADVVLAATAAQAHEFVMALPQGYDTVVGEQGLTLSGGQRQRLALARALMTDPRVLILDDATSALDTRTEHWVHEALRSAMANRTVVLVAHRRSTLLLADRIIVMERGKVLDTGTYDELMQRSRVFRGLLAEARDDDDADDDADAGSDQAPARYSGPLSSAAPATAVAALADRPFSSIVPGGLSVARVGIGTGGGFAVPDEGSVARIAELQPATDEPGVNAAVVVDAALGVPDPHTVRSLVSGQWAGAAFTLGLVVLETILGLSGPLFVRMGIDDGVRRGSSSALLRASVLFFVAAVAAMLVSGAQTRVTAAVSERILYRLRVKVFGQLQRLSLDFYERELSGRLLTRVTSDVDALSTFFQQGMVNLVVNALTLMVVAAVMLHADLALGMLAMSGVPFLVLATLWFRRVSSSAYDRSRERLASVNARLAESFSGVRVVQASGREQRNTDDFGELVDAHRRARLEGQRANSLYFPVVEFIGVASTALVLGFGLRRIDSGLLGQGAMAAYVLYLNQFFTPIQQLSTIFDTWQQAGAANRKLRGLFAVETATPAAAQPVPVPSSVRRIQLDHVTFRYGGAVTDALHDVSLTIEPGESVALVGTTGAGKSTVVKLVARLYDPTDGAVLAGGVDLRSMDQAQYRARLGVVPQEPVLFSGTIAHNIAYGRPEATREQVIASATSVGADALIDQMPDGYDTVVTARGRSLSAGERQLVALARAHLVDPQILLLDEATAQLDLSTEARVQHAFESLGGGLTGRTTVLIAHRLDSARRADRIIVMEAGRVVETGTHTELLAREGHYASMWAAQ